MKSPRTYQNIQLNVGTDIELDKNASHHLTKVLRLKSHDDITLFNGNGCEYSASLSLEGKKIFAHINNEVETDRESNLKIILFQGISKGDRMDMCIQKSVELGVTKILPVICQRTVVNLKADRAEKKIRHWQSIIINACEQSGRNVLPELITPLNLKGALQQPLDGLKLTLAPDAHSTMSSYQPDTNQVSLLIGPEGGLTKDEINLSIQNQFNTALLGKRILRTETAAIAAISTIQSLWGDF